MSSIFKLNVNDTPFTTYRSVYTPEVSSEEFPETNYKIPEVNYTFENTSSKQDSSEKIDLSFKDYSRTDYKVSKRNNNLKMNNNYNKADKKLFDDAFDKFENTDPDAKTWRSFLTKTALRESGFRLSVLNQGGAPAWGYFQFMQGTWDKNGKTYNNVETLAGTDLLTFLDNPQVLMKGAMNMIRLNLRSIRPADYDLAKKKGFDLNTLKGKELAMHIMWLAGSGGFHSWLAGKSNPSDGNLSADDMVKMYS